MTGAPPSRQVTGSRVDATTYDDALARILVAAGAEGGHVCCADAHMLVRARREAGLRAAMQAALLVCPDGAPVAWALRRLVLDGPDLAWLVLAEAERQDLAVAFYGGHPDAAAHLQAVVRERHPRLQVAAIAPPFRALGEQELAVDLADLRGARVILVGLGCPKQELWMQTLGGTLPGAVLLGVGAWFDFASRRIRRVQWIGMEWCFCILTDRRLLFRYAWVVPTFGPCSSGNDSGRFSTDAANETRCAGRVLSLVLHGSTADAGNPHIGIAQRPPHSGEIPT